MGGDLLLRGGSGVTGGGVEIQGGDATDNHGGNLNIKGGDSRQDDGGSISVNAGRSFSETDDSSEGGSLEFTSGAGVAGGNLIINAGAGSACGGGGIASGDGAAGGDIKVATCAACGTWTANLDI